MTQGGFIYAIGAVGTTYVKIGSTRTDVHTRLKALQIGQPFPLHTVATVAVAMHLRRIEKQIHAFLAEEHQRGEWFDVAMDAEQLTALVARAIAWIEEQERRAVADSEEQHGSAVTFTELKGVKPIPGLGARIQQLREQRGLSVQELAERADTTYQSIWCIERGEQKDPSIALVRGIARAFGVGVDYLISMFTEDENSEWLAPAVA
jgi:DNA-binding XRE family transcriptional regulator